MTARITLVWLIASVLAAAPASAAVTVFLARHAERSGDMDSDPPLSPAGRERAELLARMLADAGIRRIYTSELKRVQETAAPLARKLGIAPQQIDGNDALVAAVRSLTSGAVLVVGRTSTIPDLIAALGGPTIPRIAEDEYDNLFVLTISGQDVTLVRLRYGAPRPQPRIASAR
jgi:phosphohistidine phosphatase SixA